MAAHDDKERNLQTIIKVPEPDPVELTGEEATVGSMQSPFQGKPAQLSQLAQPVLEKTAHRDPVIGTSVSGYLVKGRLGSGGMGIVYEGEQQTIGKRVAIKVLRPEVAENPDVVERLVSEARAVNQVGHRGIIDVFAFGELPDGRQCIVMEYLDGESLDAILNMYIREKRMMPVGDVLIILDEILSALAAAHAAGIIHRDLKPSNIFLCKQRDGARYVKLLDFGIAKLGVLGNATPQSRASLMMGTPSYMSPEQAKGGNIGPAMDLYAVGVLAFEMFTGRLPFLADSVVAMLMAHQSEVPPLPSSLNLTLPDGIDDMVMKLLEKKPEDRSQSADVVRAMIIKLKKELVDPTSKRMQLEVTISEKERAFASARASAPPPPAKPAHTPLPVPVPATMQTAIAAKPKQVQKPAQVASTHEDLGKAAAVVGSEDDPTLDKLPRSSRAPMMGVAAVVVLLLIGGAYVATRPSETEPTPPVTKVKPKPPEPVAVAKVEPPPAVPVVKEEPPPVAVEPPPVVKEEPKVEPPPVVKEEPKVVAPVAKVVDPAPVVKPKALKGGGLAARLKKLETRLDQAVAAGGSVELYLKQVKKIEARLAEPALTADEKDRLESAIARLEQSTDF